MEGRGWGVEKAARKKCKGAAPLETPPIARTISGTSPDGSLAELIELRDHPYFLACQYHPEFQSKPNKPHPLFKGFIEACLAHQG